MEGHGEMTPAASHRGSVVVQPLGYEPCKLGHRFACPTATTLPLPDQRCFCGAVTWSDAEDDAWEARSHGR